MGTSAFFVLMKSVRDHLKMIASKAKAKAKLGDLERKVAEEDKKAETGEENGVKEDKEGEAKAYGKRLKTREVHWERGTSTVSP